MTNSSRQRAASGGVPFHGRSGYGVRWTGAAETGGAKARREAHPDGTFIVPTSKNGWYEAPDGSLRRIKLVGQFREHERNKSRRRRARKASK